MRSQDLEVGDQYNDLTVKVSPERLDGKWMVVCECKCGNEHSCLAYHLITGNTKSCGCRQIAAVKLMNTTTKTKHGQSTTILYRRWQNMINRCKSESSDAKGRYYARGIKVCEEWSDFLVFKTWAMENGYSNKLDLDRIDGDGDYTPNNCRYITHSENVRNTERFDQIWVVNGCEYSTLRVAGDNLNVSPATVANWCKGIKGRPPKDGCFVKRAA